jgi:hypothetical protein
MAKKIYPGNYVNRLSSYQGQPAVCVPGRVYYHITGYALVNATGGTSFDVIIPSPDKRGDDKPRADITGLTLPAGANVYYLGVRVPDLRKDRGVGTAFSGLVGTNTDRIKLADALANDNVLTATTLSTNSATIAVASTTVAPVAASKSVITPVALTGAETLKVYVTNSTGTAAGSTLTSSLTGGTPIICEVAYYLDDAVAELNDVSIPYITES